MGNTANSNSNVQKLLAAGVSQDFINSELAKGKSGLAVGQYIDDKDVAKFLSAWKANQPAQVSAELQARIDALPDSIKNSPEFQALTSDQKEISVYNYELQTTNNEEKAKALAQALELATAQADPYWKNLYLIAQDEVLRSFEQAQGDYDSSLQRQQNIIQNLNEDLSSNKEFYSLEYQQELAELSRSYQSGVESVIAGAADKGLTFSTKRKIAEQRLAEENQGLVESSQRQYNKQIADLEAEAARGNITAQQEIADLQRRLSETKTSLGRNAESVLGTENLPSLTGYSALGTAENPIAGTMYEEKVSDIEERKEAIYDELTSNSLNT